MKTSDDPTPALLSAARLDEIRAADAATHPLAMSFACHDRRALLAHLDALTAGEVPASLYGDLNWAAKSDGEARSREMVAAAYVRGRAAGRAEGEAERARLQAELAEARAAAERWKLACERQEQANASADREDDKRVEAARVEGARVERREWSALLTIVDRITFDAPDDKPNGPGEQAIDDMSKALEVDRWPSNVRSRIADLNGHMATLCDALADDCHDLKAAADALRARGEDRPPCPGAGWEWDAFALQWFQPGAKGKAIAVPNRDRGAGGAG